ncbi:Txe/YoeB family addiction module toxin [Marinilactibacillus piezotolerans]|uniref:Txe/YoeB family addiction module toxin n=1 Tax=Marinilactibacillus piezotolerans TaxID=258723 RepID=UPI0009B08B7F|nr:Txe/YoeB family addiction module toxin [Marinilactibacillus piezotolerans]
MQIKNSAKRDLKNVAKSNLKDQVKDIIDTLKENPYKKTQSFEKLLTKVENRYSRRINRQHRVVYRVDEVEKVVSIYSAWAHYE